MSDAVTLVTIIKYVPPELRSAAELQLGGAGAQQHHANTSHGSEGTRSKVKCEGQESKGKGVGADITGNDKSKGKTKQQSQMLKLSMRNRSKETARCEETGGTRLHCRTSRKRPVQCRGAKVVSLQYHLQMVVSRPLARSQQRFSTRTMDVST